ncbi:MAG: alpha/beta hydrolase [Lachnospiraceae bacterium]|nr:alpha/beta hydrolase [Lachnospiraceae bacterium]
MKFEPFCFEDFPSYDAAIEGVIDVQGDISNTKGRMVDVHYQEDCIIRFLFPENATEQEKKYPLIVHVQGSGWYPQDMGDHVFDFFPIVKRGFAYAIVQYHGTPAAQFPTQIIDVKKALRYIAAHAGKYPIDVDKMFLSGDSSGGNVAMLTLLTYNSHELDDEQTELPKLKGCMDFYGVMDLLSMDDWWSAFDHEEEHNIRDFLGSDYRNPDVRKNASPYWRLKEGIELPPVLILHGSKDAVVPFTQSLTMYEKMRAYHYDVKLVRVYGANHGGPVFYSENTYQEILKFLENKL